MKKNTSFPFRKVLREQRRIVLWGVYHVFTIGCFALGLYYCREYMFLPDRVLLMDNSGSLYTGKSGNILCHAVADDMARRAAFAFLDRSYEHENRAQCEAIFGRTAQKALFGVIGESKDEFSEQRIRQFPERGHGNFPHRVGKSDRSENRL